MTAEDLAAGASAQATAVEERPPRRRRLTWHPAGPDPADPRADRVAGWVLVAAGVAAVVLLVALVAKVLTWDWAAAGDYGTIRLHVLDVGTSHTPLVGVYSRWGWNHPGPMLFYGLAPFLRGVGDDRGLLLGALVLNALSLAGAVWVAARAGRRTLALVALTASALVVGLGTAGLLDPWNPYVLVVPLFTTAVAAWRTAVGDRVAAVVLVVAGSFAVQSHVLAAPPVLALLAVAAVGLGWRCWRGPDRTHDRRSGLLAVGVGLLCWLPPLVQQLTGSPGNLGEIVDFVLHGQEQPVGWALGARVVGRALSWPPTWITGGLSTETRPVPWALFALLAATTWAWRRRWTSELVLCATALVLALAAFVGSARVTGVAYPYLFRWVWMVGALAWLATAAVVVAELRRRWEWARWSATALASVTVVVLVGLLVAGPDTADLDRSSQPLQEMSGVVDQTVDALRQAPGPVIIVPTAFGIDTTVGIEVMARAREAGLDVGFSTDLGFVYGPQRSVDPSTAASTLVLAAGRDRDGYAGDPRYTKVLDNDPLSADEWAELDRLDTIDWSTRDDGATNPGPEFRRWQELSDRAFLALSVYLADGPPDPSLPVNGPP